MTMRPPLLLLFLIWLPGRSLSQATLFTPHPGQRAVFVSAGAHPHLVASTGYQQRLRCAPASWQAAWHGLVEAPMFASRPGPDLVVSVGGSATIVALKKWALPLSSQVEAAHTADIQGKRQTLGMRASVYPGWYSTRWGLGLHLEGAFRPLIHISHSPYSRQAFEELPVSAPADGWYRQPYFRYRAGLVAGGRWQAGRWQAEAGMQQFLGQHGAVLLPDLGILPFYGRACLTFDQFFSRRAIR